jgi:hypothetical protein
LPCPWHGDVLGKFQICWQKIRLRISLSGPSLQKGKDVAVVVKIIEDVYYIVVQKQ